MERSHHIPLAFILALAGCAAPGPEVRVRAQAGVAAVEGEGGLQQAQFLYARGEYALAIEAYRKVIRFSPQNALGYAGLAASYDRIGRFDLADRYYQLALALQPRNPDLARNYAGALARQGFDQRAARLLQDMGGMDRGPQEGVALAERVAVRGPQLTIQLDPPRRPTGLEGAAGRAGTRMQLERLSLAEVALVTRSVAVAPDRPAALSAFNVRGGSILNGVGRRGQAARMRAHLQTIGWSGAAIADSALRPQQSRLLAPAARIGEAYALADRLPFRVSVMRSTKQSAMVLVLGANAVRFDDQLMAKRR